MSDSTDNLPVDVEELDERDEEETNRNEEKQHMRKRRSPNSSPLKSICKKRKCFEPIYNHHPHHPLVPGGLQLHKPIIYSHLPTSISLQQHHPPPLTTPTPGIFTLYPLPLPTPHAVQWLKQAHTPPTPSHHPHPLLSPIITGSTAKPPPIPCAWPCRPLHPNPAALSPRQDDKFMFVRLADSTHWQCKLCNRVFTSQGSLRAHARIHNNEKPYRCKYCQRPFTQASTLRSHERLHTGEKPYKCDVCSKTFTQSAGLRSHKKTHTPR